ncbi:MAG: DUF99 family protein [Nitrososphaerota archaeon]|jgi:endonuclease V-like protein UPF0215 family|nr:DUF99 family protein [Nitrososphaerota archaeon]MDG6936783.1 DUF99 family protein [Nitrososphaerota archaeon]MDG6943639.1 DUF99 family protein [Nitrososphaerota archaeon]
MKMARVLGIAESFSLNQPLSFLSGVVMRRDFAVDGVSITTITVGGSDATDMIIKLYSGMRRNDISAIMINGCVLSMYNIVEAGTVSSQTGLPVVCIASSEGRDLEGGMTSHGNFSKVEQYRSLGRQARARLKTGYDIWVRAFGLELNDAVNLLNEYTVSGRVPEPVRVARLISSACLRASAKGACGKRVNSADQKGI